MRDRLCRSRRDGDGGRARRGGQTRAGHRRHRRLRATGHHRLLRDRLGLQRTAGHAIVDEVEGRRCARPGYKPARREGTREGRWVLLDYIDIVVHVQHTDERNFYALDRLWRDCPLVPVDLDDVQADAEPS